MRIRIVSDGIESHVFDAETGEELPATDIEWEHKMGEVSKARVTLLVVETCLEGLDVIKTELLHEECLENLSSALRWVAPRRDDRTTGGAICRSHARERTRLHWRSHSATVVAGHQGEKEDRDEATDESP